MKKLDKKQVFRDFLSTNQVLIVDKNSASRRRLVKTILDLGGKRHQVDSVSHFSEAKQIITDKTPKLVLSDYDLNGGSGFDLFKEYRHLKPGLKDATLVLITANISQSAVAKAAEEDVDSFIIKPYTVQSLEISLVKAVVEKLHPSKYVETIEKGKEALFAASYEEATRIFAEAIKLSSKPSLALFYHGQAQHFLSLDSVARDDYKKGLGYNSIHFKCQVGLYDFYQKEKMYSEAYAVAQNISKYFPSNPVRLKEIIRLCMITENYPDMNMYYDHFKELDERTSDVVSYVCSGLYIYGKVMLEKKDKGKAKDAYDKIAVACAGVTRFLRDIITQYHRNDMHPDAIKLMARFPTDALQSEDFFVASFLSSCGTMPPGEKVFHANEIYNKGFRDLDCMIIMARALAEEGKLSHAEDICFETRRLWPGNKRLSLLPKLEEVVAAASEATPEAEPIAEGPSASEEVGDGDSTVDVSKTEPEAA